MFCAYNERANSPLNQEQTVVFKAFCKALTEYQVSDACRFYYADSDSFKDRNSPLVELICNLQKMLDAIQPSILIIIAGLEKTHPLKLELQKSLMALAKVFFELRFIKNQAADDKDIVSSDAQKKERHNIQNAWLAEETACNFSNVQVFERQYLSDIQHFTGVLRDFFPTSEEYDVLFTILRQDGSQRFWDERRDALQQSLYKLLISAFKVQVSSVPKSQLLLSVVQTPMCVARELTFPLLAQSKQRPIGASSIVKPMLLPMFPSPASPEKPKATGSLADEGRSRLPLQPCSATSPPFWANQQSVRVPTLVPASPEKPTQCIKRSYPEEPGSPPKPKKVRGSF